MHYAQRNWTAQSFHWVSQNKAQGRGLKWLHFNISERILAPQGDTALKETFAGVSYLPPTEKSEMA